MAFGVYPAVSLAQARALRDDAKKKLAEGIDPSLAKKEEKLVRDVQFTITVIVNGAILIPASSPLLLKPMFHELCVRSMAA
ncbi:hypothetical protein BK364_26270 [Escherichia coli]|nr:hypothetical protein BK364_26270 [Escherichia coli]